MHLEKIFEILEPRYWVLPFGLVWSQELQEAQRKGAFSVSQKNSSFTTAFREEERYPGLIPIPSGEGEEEEEDSRAGWYAKSARDRLRTHLFGHNLWPPTPR